jgi:hypothetical protein
MSKHSRPKPFTPLTPMRLQMLKDARDHGSPLRTLQHGRATGITRAMRIMIEGGLLASGSRAITPAARADPARRVSLGRHARRVLLRF